MFGKIKFRMLAQYNKEAVENMADLIRREGFEIYDLRGSDIVKNSDDSKISQVYILCCKGKKSEYERFKHKHKLDEITHEGFRTLM